MKPPNGHTAGAVALDKAGNLAAATSTGGKDQQAYPAGLATVRRCAGCYANNAAAAVSCTGTGEVFIRALAAYDITAP